MDRRDRDWHEYHAQWSNFFYPFRIRDSILRVQKWYLCSVLRTSTNLGHRGYSASKGYHPSNGFSLPNVFPWSSHPGVFNVKTDRSLIGQLWSCSRLVSGNLWNSMLTCVQSARIVLSLCSRFALWLPTKLCAESIQMVEIYTQTRTHAQMNTHTHTREILLCLCHPCSARWSTRPYLGGITNIQYIFLKIYMQSPVKKYGRHWSNGL